MSYTKEHYGMGVVWLLIQKYIVLAMMELKF